MGTVWSTKYIRANYFNDEDIWMNMMRKLKYIFKKNGQQIAIPGFTWLKMKRPQWSRKKLNNSKNKYKSNFPSRNYSYPGLFLKWTTMFSQHCSDSPLQCTLLDCGLSCTFPCAVLMLQIKIQIQIQKCKCLGALFHANY